MDKRQAILDAALALFACRGFHGTAVPEVAKAAGVGAGTIYRYFDGKEALVNALYREWKGRLTRSVVDGFPFEAPPREQFRAFWRRMTAFAVAHPTALMFLELHHHAGYLDAESRAVEQELMALARGYFSATSAAEITRRADPDLLTAVVMGVLYGVLRAAYEERIALTPDLLDQAETCAWEAIRA